MNRVFLYFAVAIGALLILYTLMSVRIRKRSAKNEQLRRRGEALLAEANSVPDAVVMDRLNALIDSGSIVVARRMNPTVVPAWAQGVNHALIEQFETISGPFAGVEIALPSDLPKEPMIDVGENRSLGLRVQVDTRTNGVQVGRDRFTSLGHYLVFVADS